MRKRASSQLHNLVQDAVLFLLFDMSKLVGFENGDLLPADDANNTRERERVIVIMPDDDLQDASASEEPVVLVEAEGVETTTQPKIIVPPFGAFRKGINLLSKEQRIKALWKEYEHEAATGGLEHLIDGGINES